MQSKKFSGLEFSIWNDKFTDNLPKKLFRVEQFEFFAAGRSSDDFYQIRIERSQNHRRRTFVAKSFVAFQIDWKTSFDVSFNLK